MTRAAEVLAVLGFFYLGVPAVWCLLLWAWFVR